MMNFRRSLGITVICIFGAYVGSAQMDVLSGQWTTIFEGVRYLAENLSSAPEGRGLVHIVEVDLKAPGIELFVTPLDPDAVRHGWEYRLAYVSSVTRKERLAVAINAGLFTSRSLGFLQLPGDLARSVETLVADSVVNHFWEHTYLLAFDHERRAWFTLTKPPSASVLKRARWAVGGQAVDLREGRVWTSSSMADARTAVALDQSGEHLYLAVAEHISPHRLLTKLAEQGGWTGMMLDGGHSSSLVVGAGANGVKSGVLFGGWRPVATVLGVRAKRLYE